ncbi:probable GH family 25 lysozyme 3 [Prorops nasuta]|uniref:probable GH family 25 lysozyme 3 n=1 Tax=Prorops nasuta TaxID=863751 RepID=UPI0034CD0D0B
MARSSEPMLAPVSSDGRPKSTTRSSRGSRSPSKSGIGDPEGDTDSTVSGLTTESGKVTWTRGAGGSGSAAGSSGAAGGSEAAGSSWAAEGSWAAGGSEAAGATASPSAKVWGACEAMAITDVAEFLINWINPVNSIDNIAVTRLIVQPVREYRRLLSAGSALASA